MLEIYSVDQDQVVRAAVGQGKVTYEYALDNIYPLIDRLDIQRKVQDPKFYDRLKRDILHGCVMPPITLAFIEEDPIRIENFTCEELQSYVASNIGNGFVLDGIQRLNTIHRASSEAPDTFPMERSIYFSVLICGSVDSLLYRMITLNNGQRSTTTRHQIEILTTNLFEFPGGALPVITEKKSTRKKGMFKQADFVLAYLAFLSNSTTIDNQKLIEEKLDQLIAFKILETDISKDHVEFSEVLNLIEALCNNDALKESFRNVNNLVGFSSAIRKSISNISNLSVDNFENLIIEFEKAFASFSVSKIKLGQARRNAVSCFIEDFQDFHQLNYLEMTEKLAKFI